MAILSKVFIFSMGILTLRIKRPWNTVIVDGSIPQSGPDRMIDNPFALVVKDLIKSDRLSLQ